MLASGQEKFQKNLSQFVHQSWLTRDGLPQNTITAITQTNDGYIWLGSRAGLIRFDGVKFQQFTKNDIPGLTDDYIWTICPDVRGGFWAGTSQGGLIRYNDGQFRVFTVKDGLADNGIWEIYQARDRSLWIGTSGGGVSHYKNGDFTTYTANDGLSGNYIWSVYEDKSGKIWVGTDGDGLTRITMDDPEIRFNTSLGFGAGYIFDITGDSLGNLWFGTEMGVFEYADGVFSDINQKLGLSEFIGWSILRTQNGELWVGTEGDGLFRIENRGYSTFRTVDGLHSALITSLHQDREGNIWAGTKGGGLNRFRDGLVTTFANQEGLFHDLVYTVHGLQTGGLLVGTVSGGVYNLQDGAIQQVRFADELSNNIIFAIEEGHSGVLWLGTDGAGLNMVQDGEVRHISIGEGVGPNTIWALHQDDDGKLWIGTGGAGLFSREPDGENVRYYPDTGLHGEFISKIIRDKDGTLWVTTRDNGIAWYDEYSDIFHELTVEDGLPSDIVWTIYQGQSGVLWVGTNNGVAQVDNGKVVKDFANPEPLNIPIYGIVEDNVRNMWFSTPQGIFRMQQDGAAIHHTEKNTTKGILHFGAAEGMKTEECNYGSPSVWKSEEGFLYFPTMSGVVRIDPAEVAPDRNAPPVKIESAVVGDSLCNADSLIVIQPQYNEFEIRYTALSYISPNEITFHYQLEGFDSDWKDAGARREAYYTNLPPGDYTFSVIAHTGSGGLNSIGDQVRVRVLPKYYQTLWFKFAVGVGIIGLLGLIFYGRIWQLERRERELERRVAAAIAEVKELSGLLPICASCKKIRDDKGYWNQLEGYISEHSSAQFSHGICPDCMEELYGEYIPSKSSERRENPESS